MPVTMVALGLALSLVLTVASADDAQVAREASLGYQFSEGLKNQHLRSLETRGESITIMAVGESGLGKTSLMSSLFRAELLWPEQVDGEPTCRIAEQTVTFDLEGVPFSAKLIDTLHGGVLLTDTLQAKRMNPSREHDALRLKPVRLSLPAG